MASIRIVALLVVSSRVLGQDSAADAAAKYRAELERNPRNGLAHFELGELFLNKHNFQSAANEFRAALNSDSHPSSIDVWAHINLGEIFDVTGQRDRAVKEYRKAVFTVDDTEGAQAVAESLLAEGARLDQIGAYHGQHVSYVESVKALSKMPAKYSKEARNAGLEGNVTFGANLKGDGSVGDLWLIKPLGLGLDENAKAAAERWSFELKKFDEASTPVSTPINFDFFLPEKQSRWHLLRVVFEAPAGTLPPHFVNAAYPAGEGISPAAFDEARLVAFLGRQSVVTLFFDVDQNGQPVHFQIERQSGRVWANEAISFVSKWRFSPGNKDGKPARVPCKIDLVWGERHFTKESLIRAAQEFETATLIP